MGVNISHIDSHQHVHTLPMLFILIKRLQKRFNIRKVRLSKNIYCSKTPVRQKKLLFMKLLWNFALKQCYKTKTTSGFTDLDTFYRLLIKTDISHQLIEIMTHPTKISSNDVLASTIITIMVSEKYQFEMISYNEL